MHYQNQQRKNMLNQVPGPPRASASEREVVGSNPAAAQYQRFKNGTSSSLFDARTKGVVLGT